MKRILIVDDEEDMLWMLKRNLSKGMQKDQVLTASSGEEALAILRDKNIKLVITDINMPGMNGLDLLIEISNRYPQTGVIIMTAYPSSAYENEAMMSGSLRFIEKPFDINEMRSIIRQHLKDDKKFQGTIDGIDLLDIIQINGLSRTTAALKVTTEDQEGMIFFKSGQIVHAMYEQETGEAAFFKIIAFQGGTLQNNKGVETPAVTIEKSMESLLFEAALQSDESGESSLEDEDLGLDLEYAEQDADDENDDDLLSMDPLGGGLFDSASETKQDSEDSLANNNNSDPVIKDIKNKEQIQQILFEFKRIEGIQHVHLVNKHGHVLVSLEEQGQEISDVCNMASSIFNSSNAIGNSLVQEKLDMAVFEHQNGSIIFASVNDESFLLITAGSETNIGWIRLAIKNNLTIIKQLSSS